MCERELERVPQQDTTKRDRQEARSLAMSGTGSQFTIRVRSAGNGSDQILAIASDGTIATLKSQVFEKFAVCDKNLRLIYAGKLLEPPSALVSQFNLKDDVVIHAVFTAKQSINPGGADIELSSGSFGGYASVAQDTDEGSGVGSSGGENSGRGFSRLMAERGIDHVQVAALRGYFAADIAALTARMARRDGESEALFAERVEEVWMDAQSPHSEFNLNLPPPITAAGAYNEQQIRQMEGFLQQRLLFNMFTGRNGGGGGGGGGGGDVLGGNENNPGTYRDVFIGAAMGFLFGGIAILCIWDRNMSHHQKVGILMGVILSLLTNMFVQRGGVGSNSK